MNGVAGVATRVSAGAPAGVRVRLLGGFELLVGGRPEPLPSGSQRLVAFLALQPAGLQRMYVAGVLWPDATDEHARASLRSALWRIPTSCSDLVEASATHLRFQPSVAVDFQEASASAHRALGEGALESADLDRLTESRELIPDCYEDWVVLERERFRQLRLHALEAVCDRMILAGRHAAAVRAGLAAVEGEPLRESAQRALIRAHLAEGNAGEALGQYRRFESLLRKELGLTPSAALRGLLPNLVGA